MSLTSRLGQNSIPLSISEVDSDSGIESPLCYSTPNLPWNSKSPVSMPVKDFKQSLENEKNIRKYLTHFENGPVPNALRNDKMVEVLERNYKLQVQTLLEEVNQLKLDKKICEKKMEKMSRQQTQRGPLSPRSRTEITTEINLDDSLLKKTIDAKSSTISELEFQLAQTKKENANLKMRLEGQTKQIQDFVERIADAENLKEILEEKDDEIAQLKSSLKAEELKNEKIQKELTYFRNENITFKLKSHCSNCMQPPTGATSFANGHWSYNSKDLSFFSSEKHGHHRAHSDMRVVDKILNLSDLADDTKIGVSSPSQSSVKCKTMVFSNRTPEFDEIKKPKSEVLQFQNLSVKVLSEYEEGLKKEKKTSVKSNSKTLDRIIEVNKIKSYVIEAQNKKLLSMLNSTKEIKAQSQKNV